MGRPLVGVYIPAGRGHFRPFCSKTAEMALGFESNVVKKRPKYGENGFKMAKIGQKRVKHIKMESKWSQNGVKIDQNGAKQAQNGLK